MTATTPPPGTGPSLDPPARPAPTVAEVVRWLDSVAPPVTAESWDNVGLIVGRADRPVTGVLTCLTVTEAVADEAATLGADLVVSHHPLLFRPVQRLTDRTAEGRTILRLVEAGVAVVSPHTAWDGAVGGVNDQLAASLGLTDVRPLEDRTDRAASPERPGPGGLGAEDGPRLGVGRIGRLPAASTVADVAAGLAAARGLALVRHTGDPARTVTRVACACGSGGGLLPLAVRAGADLLVTGEATYHDLLAADGVTVVLLGHFASEQFSLAVLGDRLTQAFPGVTCRPSRADRDPVEVGDGPRVQLLHRAVRDVHLRGDAGLLAQHGRNQLRKRRRHGLECVLGHGGLLLLGRRAVSRGVLSHLRERDV